MNLRDLHRLSPDAPELKQVECPQCHTPFPVGLTTYIIDVKHGPELEGRHFNGFCPSCGYFFIQSLEDATIHPAFAKR